MYTGFGQVSGREHFVTLPSPVKPVEDGERTLRQSVHRTEANRSDHADDGRNATRLAMSGASVPNVVCAFSKALDDNPR